MTTRSSINAAEIDIPCYATKITCPIEIRADLCTAFDCPFYKPAGAKDWVRIEDEEGISFIPPEEYMAVAKAKAAEPKQAVWRIKKVRR